MKSTPYIDNSNISNDNLHFSSCTPIPIVDWDIQFNARLTETRSHFAQRRFRLTRDKGLIGFFLNRCSSCLGEPNCIELVQGLERHVFYFSAYVYNVLFLDC